MWIDRLTHDLALDISTSGAPSRRTRDNVATLHPSDQAKVIGSFTTRDSCFDYLTSRPLPLEPEKVSQSEMSAWVDGKIALMSIGVTSKEVVRYCEPNPSWPH